jgi:alanine racemase
MAMAEGACADGILTIDLGALAANYRLLRDRAAPAECAAAVKADGYGLGAERVVSTLAEAGCRTFFVANVDEGIAVRRTLAHRSDAVKPDVLTPDPLIYVLNGPEGAESALVEHDLRPVLNSLRNIAAWAECARRCGACLAAALHVDTGMARLGLPGDELDRLVAEPGRLEGLRVTCLMSHLACADSPDHPLNRRQLDAFRSARERLPAAPASLANSSGIFLGLDYHADLVRPGAALYGLAPFRGRLNPMAQVVRLEARILQVREIDTDCTVGYGATHCADRPERIATVAAGYADGYLRSLSNRGSAFIAGRRVPLVGRVSMDLITFDVSDVPQEHVIPGTMVELIGPDHPVDAVAADAGTIGYEILTALGPRYRRIYVGG